MLLAYIYRSIAHRVHFFDKASRDLFICAKDLFVAAISGGGHDEKEGAPAGGGLGSVPVPARASWQSELRRNLGIRPFPLCCIALSRMLLSRSALVYRLVHLRQRFVC